MALSKSRLGPDHMGVKLGVVVESWGDTLHIVWDDEPDVVELWRSADARYEVDRGLMRFTPPPKKRRLRLPSDELVCQVCGARGKARKRCPADHKGPGAVKPEHWGKESMNPALTTLSHPGKMTSSNQQGSDPLPSTEEGNDMATEKLSAKAAAIEIGTDARTLRKFLRSDASSFEACGQGNRYEFTAAQLKKLRKEFEAWGGGKTAKKAKEPIAQEPDDEDIETIDDADIEIDEDEESDEDVDDDEELIDELDEVEIED